MNIYVANLSFQSSNNDLKDLFSPYGEVTSAKIINDNTTGRSRGFGFVEMPDKNEALRAIEELHESTFDGKVIVVNEARPKTDRPRGEFDRNRNYNSGGNSGGFRGDRRPKSW